LLLPQPVYATQITINGDIFNSYAEQNASPQVVFTTDSIGYAFYIDETGDDVRYKKTTDGGATWGGEVDLSGDFNFGTVGVWYDQWTPGDTTGTKIYMVAGEPATDDVWFKTLDTNGDTLSPTGTTWTTVAAGTSWNPRISSGASVTKNTDGNLFATCSSTAALDVYKSTNGGTNWSATTSGLDTNTDFNQILPVGLTGGDVLLLNHDISGNYLRSNVYDEATDSWSGFTNRIAATENLTYHGSFGAALNKLTGDVYVAVNNNPAVAGGDIKTARATSDGTTFTWNDTTDVYTDIGTAGLQATMAIDWHNGDVYCFYLRGTVGSAMDVYYKKSSDQGATWGNETGPVSSSAGDYQQVYANMTSPYKIHVSWINLAARTMFAVNYTDTSALDIADARMMLFYDGAAVPSGWTSLSASAGDIFYQRFPRGYSSYGNPAGSSTHDHTATISNFSGPDATGAVNSSGTAFSSSTHTHSFTADASAGSNVPPYRELQIIQYDAGIPSGASAIPASVIAIFDTDSMPDGWTRYSAQDDYFVRCGPDGEATGGSPVSHIHVVSFSGALNPVDTPVGTVGAFDPSFALAGHTHTINNIVTGRGDSTPLNSDIVLGQNGDSATSIPLGMMAMFTGSPGGSWTSKSGSGEDLYQRFFEAKLSYAASGGGAATHDHSDSLSQSTQGPSIYLQYDRGTGGVAALGTHIHTFDVSYSETDNLPPYVDVIVYQYPSSALGVTAPGSFTMPSGNPGTTTEYTFDTDELVAVADGGAGWTLSVSSTLWAGPIENIPAANIKLKTNGVLATEPTIITGVTTNVSETAEGTHSLDTSKNISTRTSGSASDVTNHRPTIAVVIPPDTPAADYVGTLTFTVI